jgi:colanic acid/amylovoran biosynthesis glycosyltransferase
VTKLSAAMEVELSRLVDEVQVMGDADHARVLKRHSIDTEAPKLAALFRDVCEVSRIT